MPRFVILEHDHPFLHWDFMLEAGTVLRTWRLARPPQPETAIAATYLFEHRLAYLDYEGPVSRERGFVVRWDAGTFDWLIDHDQRVAVDLHGGKVNSTAVLEHLEGEEWVFALSSRVP